MTKKILLPLTFFTTLACVSCSSSAFETLNPFNDSTAGMPGYGERNSNAILENTGSKTSQSANARHALEVLGTYRAAQDPQPYYPVMQPAEVRLMWIPDHLNRAGDLVPAHYYYLKVLDDRWAVQDAFDVERQLGDGSNEASATPWVYGGTR